MAGAAAGRKALCLEPSAADDNEKGSSMRMSWSRPKAAFLAVAALTMVALAFGVGSARATVTVNCPPYGNDNLQAAITAAAPGATIMVKGTCGGHFTIPTNLTLSGSPSATLNGQGTGRPLTIAGGVTVTLNNLTIMGGYLTASGAPGAGGGIFSFNATLTLNNCVVTGNTASAGGGIASGTPGPTQAGMLTLNSTSVTNNVAFEGGAGGILNHNGTAVISNSRITGNTAPGGGGIANGNGNGGAGGGGTLTINGSTISGNSATGGPDGGAGGIANGGSLTMSNSTVSGNQAVGGAGGGIFNHGTATITGSVITGNLAPNDNSGDQGLGGGIASVNFGLDGSGVLQISSSQVTRNQAGLGGGILSGAFGGDSSLTVDSTTVAYNAVSGEQSGGGGIANISGGFDAELQVSGSTLIGNLARQGLGGAVANASQGGEAHTSIDSTTIGSTTAKPPYTLNPNQAAFGGGIFNWSMGGPANVTLGSGAFVVGNRASVDGGGVFDADGATLTLAGGQVLLNHPDNVVNGSF
jgi:hypothetical protein